jgi:hypothetical protein
MKNFGSLGFFGVIIFIENNNLYVKTQTVRSGFLTKIFLKSYTYNTHKQSGYSELLTYKKKMDI